MRPASGIALAILPQVATNPPDMLAAKPKAEILRWTARPFRYAEPGRAAATTPNTGRVPAFHVKRIAIAGCPVAPTLP